MATHCRSSLPAGFSDNHLGAQLMKLVPQLFGFQVTGDLGHFCAGDAGGGRDEGYRTRRRSAVAVISQFQAAQITQGLRTRRLLHKLFCLEEQGNCQFAATRQLQFNRPVKR